MGFLEKETKMRLTGFILVVVTCIFCSCSGNPQPQIDWKSAISVDGDLSCQGAINVNLLEKPIATLTAKSQTLGDVNTEDGNAAACAVLEFKIGPFVWIWFESTQKANDCKDLAGALEVEDK
jgi:hypothetical protein